MEKRHLPADHLPHYLKMVWPWLIVEVPLTYILVKCQYQIAVNVVRRVQCCPLFPAIGDGGASIPSVLAWLTQSVQWMVPLSFILTRLVLSQLVLVLLVPMVGAWVLWQLSAVFAGVDMRLSSIAFCWGSVEVPMQMVPEMPGASKVLTPEVIGNEGCNLAGDRFFLGTSLFGEVMALLLVFVED